MVVLVVPRLYVRTKPRDLRAARSFAQSSTAGARGFGATHAHMARASSSKHHFGSVDGPTFHWPPTCFKSTSVLPSLVSVAVSPVIVTCAA